MVVENDDVFSFISGMYWCLGELQVTGGSARSVVRVKKHREGDEGVVSFQRYHHTSHFRRFRPVCAGPFSADQLGMYGCFAYRCESPNGSSAMSKVPEITIPDLRFEQSFLKSLQTYANGKKTLADDELKLLDEPGEDSPQFQPIAPITPGIVAMAVIKDQIIMPLIQGFLWSGFLISVRPFLGLVVASGQRCGIWFGNMVGLGQLGVRRYPATM